MKLLFFINVIICFSCNSIKKTNYKYVFLNQSSGSNVFPPYKFISNGNYLFEFISSFNYTQNNELNKNIKTSDFKTVCIYIMEKNKNEVYQIDTFDYDFKIQKSFNLNEKEYGLKINEPDIMSIKMYEKFKNCNSKDSVINKINLKVVDTSFNLNDTIKLKSLTYFSKSYKINTMFNLNSNVYEKSIRPFTLMGMSLYSAEHNLINYLITDVEILNTNENKICESIIKKIIEFKKR